MYATDATVDFSFRKILKNVDDNLMTRDLNSLKFLCRDLIPTGKLEHAERPRDIFLELEYKGILGPGSKLLFLADLLNRIHRVDLIKKLEIGDSKEVVNQLKVYQRPGPQFTKFRLLLLDVCDNITYDDLESMKYYCHPFINKGVLESIDDAPSLLSHLEQICQISDDNVDFLEEVIEVLGNDELLNQIRHYKDTYMSSETSVKYPLNTQHTVVPSGSAAQYPCPEQGGIGGMYDTPPPPYTQQPQTNPGMRPVLLTPEAFTQPAMGGQRWQYQPTQNTIQPTAAYVGGTHVNPYTSQPQHGNPYIGGQPTQPQLGQGNQYVGGLHTQPQDTHRNLYVGRQNIVPNLAQGPPLQPLEGQGNANVGLPSIQPQGNVNEGGLPIQPQQGNQYVGGVSTQTDAKKYPPPRYGGGDDLPNETAVTEAAARRPEQPEQYSKQPEPGPGDEPPNETAATVNVARQQPQKNVQINIQGENQQTATVMDQQMATEFEKLRLRKQQMEEMPCYSMNSSPLGICVIINNEEFYLNSDDPSSRTLEDRQGTKIDRDNLLHLFTNLDFHVVVKDNLTAYEMWTYLEDIGKKDHSQYSCFVCCILSHGSSGKVYGCDGVAVDVSDLTRVVKGTRCRSLVGKPKLFFMQACQGRKDQSGEFEADAAGDEPPSDTIPNEADFLLGYATVPGFVSYRSKTHGSWYITKLVECIDQYRNYHDLMSIMIKVNDEVAKAIATTRKGEKKQVPAPLVTLRKKLYFKTDEDC